MTLRNKLGPKGNGKRILVIPGGGVRGVIPAVILAALEEVNDLLVHEMFDMVVGTSAGSIIAGSAAAGIPMVEVVSMFKTSIAPAFNINFAQKAWNIMRSGVKYMYPIEPFVRPLEPKIAGLTVQKIDKAVMLIFFKDTVSGQTIYVVNKGKGLERVKDWTLSNVIQASCSAPAYLPSLGNNIDGGVGTKNDGTEAGGTEAFGYLDFKQEETTIYTIGTGYRPNVLQKGGYQGMNIAQRVLYVVSEVMDDTQEERVGLTRAIYPNADIRYFNVDLSNIELNKRVSDALGKKVDMSKYSLDSAKPNDVEAMIQAGLLYFSNIDINKPHANPWDFEFGMPKPKIDWESVSLS